MAQSKSLLSTLDNVAKQAFQYATGACAMLVGENAVACANLAGVGYDQAKDALSGGLKIQAKGL
jgi:hypothetical protein